jgi:hypothetical protein
VAYELTIRIITTEVEVAMLITYPSANATMSEVESASFAHQKRQSPLTRSVCRLCIICVCTRMQISGNCRGAFLVQKQIERCTKLINSPLVTGGNKSDKKVRDIAHRRCIKYCAAKEGQ